MEHLTLDLLFYCIWDNHFHPENHFSIKAALLVHPSLPPILHASQDLPAGSLGRSLHQAQDSKQEEWAPGTQAGLPLTLCSMSPSSKSGRWLGKRSWDFPLQASLRLCVTPLLHTEGLSVSLPFPTFLRLSVNPLSLPLLPSRILATSCY